MRRWSRSRKCGRRACCILALKLEEPSPRVLLGLGLQFKPGPRMIYFVGSGCWNVALVVAR